jgi:hypothetical protein
VTLSTACPKPERGERRKELLERRASRRTLELKAKALVKARDGNRCRVPGCRNLSKGWAPNVAHLHHKGIGGDKQLDRTKPELMLVLCFPHHIGERGSHHSGDLRIEPETTYGTHGLCAFYLSDEQQQWVSLGVG